MPCSDLSRDTALVFNTSAYVCFTRGVAEIIGADVGWKSAGERLFLRPSLPLAGLAGEKSWRTAGLPGCPAPGSARLRPALRKDRPSPVPAALSL